MAAFSDLIYKPLPDGIYKRIIEDFGCADLRNGPWISGGSVRKVWFDLPWIEQDIDYFFRSKVAFDGFVDKINKRYGNSDDLSIFNTEPSPLKTPYMTCYSTDNANTYTFEQFSLVDEIVNLDQRFKMQAIKKYFPESLDELFGTFDFNVCQFAADGKMMVATRAAVEDCEAGRLDMVPNTTRKANVVRIAKYCAYGFSPVDSLMETALQSMANDEPLVMADDY